MKTQRISQLYKNTVKNTVKNKQTNQPPSKLLLKFNCMFLGKKIHVSIQLYSLTFLISLYALSMRYKKLIL